jgi:hypothetical protein
MSTENVAFARLGQIETLEEHAKRQREDRALRAVMADVVADARRSAPFDRPGFVPPAAAPGRGNGWRTAPALEMPGGDRTQRLIEQLCNALLPHGPAHGRKPDDEPPKAA